MPLGCDFPRSSAFEAITLAASAGHPRPTRQSPQRSLCHALAAIARAAPGTLENRSADPLALPRGPPRQSPSQMDGSSLMTRLSVLLLTPPEQHLDRVLDYVIPREAGVPRADDPFVIDEVEQRYPKNSNFWRMHAGPAKPRKFWLSTLANSSCRTSEGLRLMAPTQRLSSLKRHESRGVQWRNCPS
jgi:hypothetical protein